jgi:cation transport protein ChaC
MPSKPKPSEAQPPDPQASEPQASKSQTHAPASAPWVFGYGSLMWNPGFPFQARRKARLGGYERAFCRYSFRHRGTPERPGLVIGLREADGAAGCIGVAYLPEPAQLAATMATLDGREGAGYQRVLRPIALLDGRPEAATAWVYVPNPEHPSYFGQKDPAQIVSLILQGHGESGTAYDYLAAMLGELQKMGVSESELEAMLHAVERQRRTPA